MSNSKSLESKYFCHQFFKNDPIELKEIKIPNLESLLLLKDKKVAEIALAKLFFQNSITIHPDITNLQNIYWKLGDRKWMECIDGCYHELGREVFDEGLHRENRAEPGYIESMENACKFISSSLTQRITPQWYLKLHKMACSHFEGEETHTLMDSENAGVFRDESHNIHICYSYAEVTTACLIEIPAHLGKFEYKIIDGKKKWILHFTVMTQEEVREQFIQYTNDYYREIRSANTKDQKLRAICKYIQLTSWLHPVEDGTTRTMVAVLNKLLTENGFHPVLLEHPSCMEYHGLDEWIELVKQGLLKWEAETNSIKFKYLEKKELLKNSLPPLTFPCLNSFRIAETV